MKRTDVFLIVLIFLTSFFIRWIAVDKVPYGIEGDEYYWSMTSLLTKYDIRPSEKGIWSLHEELAKSFPVSILINRLGFNIFGIDILSPRKILILFSSLALATFYILNRLFFTQFISFIITILYSFSAYKLIMSKIAEVPSYIDTFLYVALFFLLKIFSTKSKLRYIYSLLSGIGITLCIFTYNLAYLLPITCLGTILFLSVIKRIHWKSFFLITILFLTPLLITSYKWVPGLIEETKRKEYALKNVVVDPKTNKVNFFILKNNTKVIFQQLFQGLTYETSDMIVNYDSTLISRWVSFLSLLGLIFAFLNTKKYFFIIFYFFIFIFPAINFGIFLPRMWMIGMASFFMLSGITLSFLFKIFRKKSDQLVLSTLITFFALFIMTSELKIFYSEAVSSQSFLIKHREINDLAKKYNDRLLRSVFFVTLDEVDKSIIYSAATFNYLSAHSKESDLIRRSDMKSLNILDLDEFKKNTFKNNKVKILILDNDLVKNMSDSSTFKLLKKNSFYSEYIFN